MHYIINGIHGFHGGSKVFHPGKKNAFGQCIKRILWNWGQNVSIGNHLPTVGLCYWGEWYGRPVPI